MTDGIALNDKFDLIDEVWRPKIVAKLNGQEIKLVKLKGVFPWHRHEDIDEVFLVWNGAIRLEFRTHSVELGPGDAIVVPKGVEHRPVADSEAQVILFEPVGVKNTGDIEDPEFTAPQGVEI